KALQRGTQPANAHPQLMDMIDPTQRIAGNQANGVARDLIQAFVEHGSEGIEHLRVARVIGTAPLAHRRMRIAAGKRIATLRLAARIEDETKTLAPALGKGEQGLCRA